MSIFVYLKNRWVLTRLETVPKTLAFSQSNNKLMIGSSHTLIMNKNGWTTKKKEKTNDQPPSFADDLKEPASKPSKWVVGSSALVFTRWLVCSSPLRILGYDHTRVQNAHSK